MSSINLSLLASGNYRVYNYEIAKAIGVNNAIFLADIITKYLYFEENDELTEDGFFYSTADQIFETTALTRYQQENCTKELEKLGYIKTKLAGIPAKKHFKICDEVSNLALNKVPNKFGINCQTRLEETAKHTNNNIYNNINTKGLSFEKQISYEECYPDGTTRNEVKAWKRDRKKQAAQIADDAGMTPDRFVQQLINGKNSAARVVGYYIRAKEMKFGNMKQLQLELSRNMKMAKELSEAYPNENQILNALDVMRSKEYDWSLKTLLNKINEIKPKNFSRD